MFANLSWCRMVWFLKGIWILDPYSNGPPNPVTSTIWNLDKKCMNYRTFGIQEFSIQMVTVLLSTTFPFNFDSELYLKNTMSGWALTHLKDTMSGWALNSFSRLTIAWQFLFVFQWEKTERSFLLCGPDMLQTFFFIHFMRAQRLVPVIDSNTEPWTTLVEDFIAYLNWPKILGN
jgi:hypothetical protein